MPKKRIEIPEDIAACVLVASNHTCCKCNEPGKPCQIHHIDENPSNNDLDNLAVLCLVCHNDTQLHGGFGRKLNAASVRKYRDDWYARIQERKNKVDAIVVSRMAGSSEHYSTSADEAENLKIPADKSLLEYVNMLPSMLSDAYKVAIPEWNTGITSKMNQATYDVIDVVKGILIHLAGWFPKNHFHSESASEYFSKYISARYEWHRALAEPQGQGTGGTIVGTIAAGGVLNDAETAVEDLVSSLLWGSEGFSLKNWRNDWAKSRIV